MFVTSPKIIFVEYGNINLYPIKGTHSIKMKTDAI